MCFAVAQPRPDTRAGLTFPARDDYIRTMSRTTRAMLGFLSVGAIATALTALSWRYVPSPVSPGPSEDTLPAVEAGAVVPELVTENFPLRRGDTLDNLLARAGVDQSARVEMIAAVAKTFDVRKLRAGSQLMLTRSGSGSLESMEYIIDPDHKLQLSHSDGIFAAAVVDIPGAILQAPICGTMQGSLFESMDRIGERPELALQIAQIFAWDLDFYTDPREGDEFCVLLEKKHYLNGQPFTYRRILAAKYKNAGTEYNAYLFPDENGKPRYYSSDGRSLQAAFLHSPMKFDARVSSHFSYRRRHPILKIYRPHLGTDYAAPVGAPVQAVASGRVTFSGRSGGSGNLIKIKHANGFETMYLHLSRRFVRTGQRVAQGQRIGLVGATGLATGPHLDFRVRKDGRYLNFERLNPPRTTRIATQQREAFESERDRFAAKLEAASPSGGAIVASGASPATSSSTP